MASLDEGLVARRSLAVFQDLADDFFFLVFGCWLMDFLLHAGRYFTN